MIILSLKCAQFSPKYSVVIFRNFIPKFLTLQLVLDFFFFPFTLQGSVHTVSNYVLACYFYRHCGGVHVLQNVLDVSCLRFVLVNVVLTLLSKVYIIRFNDLDLSLPVALMYV